VKPAPWLPATRRSRGLRNEALCLRTPSESKSAWSEDTRADWAPRLRDGHADAPILSRFLSRSQSSTAEAGLRYARRPAILLAKADASLALRKAREDGVAPCRWLGLDTRG